MTLWETHAAAASSDAADIQSEESGPQPTPLLQAHQRIIREQRAAADADVGLWGRYWETVNRDIANAEVREISWATANSIILAYEWLGSMPAIASHCFGIYYDDVIAGAVVYGPEMSANLKGKFFDRLGVAESVVNLSRGACVHWAHPHSASKLIRVSMRMLPPQWEVVTATTDPSAGEIGTIYQACGFHFLGNRWGTVTALLIGGRVVNKRTLQSRYGTRATSGQWRGEEVRQPLKGRYVAFRGTRERQRELLQRFQPYIRPYIRRAA